MVGKACYYHANEIRLNSGLWCLLRLSDGRTKGWIHNDKQENLMAIIAGAKTFRLIPPFPENTEYVDLLIDHLVASIVRWLSMIHTIVAYMLADLCGERRYTGNFSRRK